MVIIGGSLAGAATATLLLRENPVLRVLIIERSPAFTRRVGEATVEVSAYFLGRVLGLTQYLNETQLVKQGMRFWFAEDTTATLADCHEIGARYLVRIPAYQVDRSTLDEEVLRRACALGATLLRPGRVGEVSLQPDGEQIVHVDTPTQKIRARWVVDASGVAAVLARQEGWLEPNTAHPTTAAWARWRNVKDWDGAELAHKFPDWAAACYGIRGTATNHLTGPGWWAWWIPLKGGDVSIGVVFDQRLVTFPEQGALGDRLHAFLSQHPVGRELLAEAQWIAGDVHSRKNLAYGVTQLAGDGYALVGDAAGFLDPLYSPGMDWIAYTSYATAQLILAQQRGEPIGDRLAAHNRAFTQSYQRWFEALYRDKYEYLGEYDLMRTAFVLDLGLYYFGVVSQPFRCGAAAFAVPTFSTPASTPAYHFMRTYNRRFAQIARARRQRGGRRYAGVQRFLFPGFTFSPGSSRYLLTALVRWAWLELTEGWRSWGRATPAAALPKQALPVTPEMT